MMDWLTSMPTPVRASTAAPTANGLTVEQAAAASAEQDGSGADHRVEASGHHGSGKQGVEGNGLLAHT